jgi:hypothetical protein
LDRVADFLVNESTPEGILVESGTFRVDRKRALAKLKKFQYYHPYFLVCVVQCAEAAGASRIEIKSVDGGMRVRFNGDPIPAKRIDAPFDVIFDERKSTGAAAGHLAIAALTFLGEGETAILTSGKGVRPRSVEVDAKLEVSPRPHAKRPDRAWWHTQLVFRRPKRTNFKNDTSYEYIRASYKFGSAAVTIDGDPVEEAGGFVDKGKPGFMSRLRRAGALDARVSGGYLYHLGVHHGPWSLEASWAQVEGDIRYDNFDWRLLQGNRTKEPEKRLLNLAIGRAVRRFVNRECQTQNGRVAAIGKALDNAGKRRRWRKGLRSFDRSMVYLMTRLGFSVFKNLAERDLFRDDLHRTMWLRGACIGRLKRYQSQRNSEPARSLWRCKLFFSEEGKPLSVYDIERIRVSGGGRVRVRRERHRWSRDGRTVWAPGDHDLASLRAIFGDRAIVVVGEK